MTHTSQLKQRSLMYDTHSQLKRRSLIHDTHSQSKRRSLIHDTHSQSKRRSLMYDTHSQSKRRSLTHDTHSQSKRRSLMYDTHSQSKRRSLIHDTHSQSKRRPLMYDTHSQLKQQLITFCQAPVRQFHVIDVWRSLLIGESSFCPRDGNNSADIFPSAQGALSRAMTTPCTRWAAFPSPARSFGEGDTIQSPRALFFFLFFLVEICL